MLLERLLLRRLSLIPRVRRQEWLRGLLVSAEGPIRVGSAKNVEINILCRKEPFLRHLPRPPPGSTSRLGGNSLAQPSRRNTMHHATKTDPATELFGEVISTYSRDQTLDDGVLIDAGPMARECGFRFHTAITAAAWSDCVAWRDADNERQVHQDQSGRLWDVLYMAHHALRSSRNDGDRLTFRLFRVPRDGRSTEAAITTLKLIVGSGDDGEPVITIRTAAEASRTKRIRQRSRSSRTKSSGEGLSGASGFCRFARIRAMTALRRSPAVSAGIRRSSATACWARLRCSCWARKARA